MKTRYGVGVMSIVCMGWLCPVALSAGLEASGSSSAVESSINAVDGVLQLQVSTDLPGGWHVNPPIDQTPGDVLILPFAGTVKTEGRDPAGSAIVVGGYLTVPGQAMQFINSPQNEALDVDALSIAFTGDGTGGVYFGSHYGPGYGRKVFDLSAAILERNAGGEWLIESTATLDERMSHELGIPEAAGAFIGQLKIDVHSKFVTEPQGEPEEGTTDPGLGSVAGVIGPDVTVWDVGSGISKNGTVGTITAYSMATTACNIGDASAIWIICSNGSDPSCNEHPLISQNMYRLKDNRFEQIGMSWLKHAFCAADFFPCNGTQQADGDCDSMSLNSADVYSTGLNGSQSSLGPRSEVNASTGEYPYPYLLAWQQTGNAIYKRLQIQNDDLNPGLNPGALYYAEVHYMTTDEPDNAAAAHHNNASYRRAMVGALSGGGYNLSLTTATVFAQPAINAWRANDPDVELEDAYIANDGRMVLGYKVTDIGGGMWHYEYALYNMNSHRSAQSFTVPLPADATAVNTGFHDVDYHSGEPYSLTDWTPVVSGVSVNWSTQTFAQNVNANALRWGTLYNFRFDSGAPPYRGDAVIGLFRPGTPTAINVTTLVPGADCNSNEVADADDISGGASPDTDGNGIPDECESTVATFQAEGPRYLAVELNGGSDPYALYVTGDSEDAAVSCVTRYVQANGSLGANAVFRTSAQWGSTLHLTGDEIIPGKGYSLQLDSGSPGSPNLGSPMSATTWPWGDVNFNGATNFEDVQLLIQAFQGMFLVSVENGDLEPCEPNGVINFGDILLDIGAFQGSDFDATGCPLPCP